MIQLVSKKETQWRIKRYNNQDTNIKQISIINMVNDKYIAKIKEILQKHLTNNEKVFIFGSSVDSEKFNDVDLGIVSDNFETEKAIYKIKDDLEESTLPYKFDVININQTNDPFRTRVLNGPKIWII